MKKGDILILNGSEVSSLLSQREDEILHIVRKAYETHAMGYSALPFSAFLRPSQEASDRFIALPSYLGQEFAVAGLKWVSSFPGNIKRGMDRASAVIILNSTETGQPLAILEGATINAKRTAASAALAALFLQRGDAYPCLGVVGCGLINFEIVRFISTVYPGLHTFVLFDKEKERVLHFQKKCEENIKNAEFILASNANTVFEIAPLVSLATTASTPYIFNLAGSLAGTTILHISLRDLSPAILLASDNIVDDIDHVCREQTSIHLAEQQVHHRDFIRCTLGDILQGKATARQDTQLPVIFSPFGLGILDIAVAQLVYDLALSAQCGTLIPAFSPPSWSLSSTTKELKEEMVAPFPQKNNG